MTNCVVDVLVLSKSRFSSQKLWFWSRDEPLLILQPSSQHFLRMDGNERTDVRNSSSGPVRPSATAQGASASGAPGSSSAAGTRFAYPSSGPGQQPGNGRGQPLPPMLQDFYAQQRHGAPNLGPRPPSRPTMDFSGYRPPPPPSATAAAAAAMLRDTNGRLAMNPGGRPLLPPISILPPPNFGLQPGSPSSGSQPSPPSGGPRPPVRHPSMPYASFGHMGPQPYAGYSPLSLSAFSSWQNMTRGRPPSPNKFPTRPGQMPFQYGPVYPPFPRPQQQQMGPQPPRQRAPSASTISGSPRTDPGSNRTSVAGSPVKAGPIVHFPPNSRPAGKPKGTKKRSLQYDDEEGAGTEDDDDVRTEPTSFIYIFSYVPIVSSSLSTLRNSPVPGALRWGDSNRPTTPHGKRRSSTLVPLRAGSLSRMEFLNRVQRSWQITTAKFSLREIDVRNDPSLKIGSWPGFLRRRSSRVSVMGGTMAWKTSFPGLLVIAAKRGFTESGFRRRQCSFLLVG